jgi:hypothetical protein
VHKTFVNFTDIEIQIWNPQSGHGPATCQVAAGSGDPANCSDS